MAVTDDKIDSVEHNMEWFDPVQNERVRDMILRFFPVEEIRKLRSSNRNLVNFYVRNHFQMYETQRLTSVDLGEAHNEDFMGWVEANFRSVEAHLLCNMRNHFLANRIVVQKQAELAIEL